jgi:hypothetical protein
MEHVTKKKRRRWCRWRFTSWLTSPYFSSNSLGAIQPRHRLRSSTSCRCDAAKGHRCWMLQSRRRKKIDGGELAGWGGRRPIGGRRRRRRGMEHWWREGIGGGQRDVGGATNLDKSTSKPLQKLRSYTTEYVSQAHMAGPAN